MSDLRVEVRFRNLPLYKAIFAKHKSVAEFCRKHKLSQTLVGKFLNLTVSPWRKHGSMGFRAFAVRVATALNMLTEDLFPESVYKISHPRKVLELDSTRLRQFVLHERDRLEQLSLPPDLAMEAREMHDEIQRAFGGLTPREERVLRLRFGLGVDSDHTLEEVARDLKVTRERLRQIEAKALRKLRQPERSRKLKTFSQESDYAKP